MQLKREARKLRPWENAPMAKRLQIALVAIVWLIFGGFIAVAPFEFSKHLRRSAAVQLYRNGFDASARAVWRLAEWTGDTGARANLAILEYRDFQIQHPNRPFRLWYEQYMKTDETLALIKAERGAHFYNRAIIRLTFEHKPEWLASAIKMLRAAQNEGNEVAGRAADAYAKSEDIYALRNVLAENGDPVAAMLMAWRAKIDFRDHMEAARYGQLALDNGDKSGVNFFVHSGRVNGQSETETKVRIAKRYADEGVIDSMENLVRLYLQEYYEKCSFKDKENCHTESQMVANRLLEKIAFQNCALAFPKQDFDKSGLLKLDLSDYSVMNCETGKEIATVQLADRNLLGIGTAKDKGEALRLLSQPWLADHSNVQTLLAQLKGDKAGFIYSVLNNELNFKRA